MLTPKNGTPINGSAEEQVVGGALQWGGGDVYPVDDPSAVYHYNDYDSCADYIKRHWPGGPQTEATLIMLMEAGLVWK